jgi:hypothetical protein
MNLRAIGSVRNAAVGRTKSSARQASSGIVRNESFLHVDTAAAA